MIVCIIWHHLIIVASFLQKPARTEMSRHEIDNDGNVLLNTLGADYCFKDYEKNMAKENCSYHHCFLKSSNGCFASMQDMKDMLKIKGKKEDQSGTNIYTHVTIIYLV